MSIFPPKGKRHSGRGVSEADLTRDAMQNYNMLRPKSVRPRGKRFHRPIKRRR